MRTKLFLLAPLCLALAVPAFAEDLPSDLQSLLQVHGRELNVAGPVTLFEQRDLIIFAGGTTLSIRQSKNLEVPSPFFAEIATGVGTPTSFRALAEALAESRIGFQTGNCKVPLSNAGYEYEITWFGRTGRFNTIHISSEFEENCPQDLRNLVVAILTYEGTVIADDKTQIVPARR